MCVPSPGLCRRRSLLAQNQVYRPAAADVRAGAAEVAEDVGVGASRILQGARQDEFHPGAGPDEQHQGAWTFTVGIKGNFDVTNWFRK